MKVAHHFQAAKTSITQRLQVKRITEAIIRLCEELTERYIFETVFDRTRIVQK